MGGDDGSCLSEAGDLFFLPPSPSIFLQPNKVGRLLQKVLYVGTGPVCSGNCWGRRSHGAVTSPSSAPRAALKEV